MLSVASGSHEGLLAGWEREHAVRREAAKDVSAHVAFVPVR
jgi:hypothetical protein